MEDILVALANEQAEVERSEAHREKRDGLVVQAYEEGYTIRQIGEAIGRSHQAVAKIVRRRRGNRG